MFVDFHTYSYAYCRVLRFTCLHIQRVDSYPTLLSGRRVWAGHETIHNACHHPGRMTFVPDRRSAGYEGHSCCDILLRHKTVHVHASSLSIQICADYFSRILNWISGFRVDFWISDWISGFHSGFRISAWISGFLDFTVDFWFSVRISADGVRDFFRDGPLVREKASCLAVL